MNESIAEEVTDTLLERANKVTPFKLPGTNLNGNNTPSNNGTATTETKTVSNEIKSGKSTKVGKEWLFTENDFIPQEINPVETEAEEKEITTEVKKNDKGEVVTLQDQQASAETAVALLDLAMTSIFTPIELARYKKAFKNYDWKRVKDIPNEVRAKLSDEEKILFDKVVNANKKYKHRRSEIEMTVDDIRKKEKAFFGYFKATGTKLSPSALLWSNIITTIGERTTDILLDDPY